MTFNYNSIEEVKLSGINTLRSAVYTQSTLARYTSMVNKFITYCIDNDEFDDINTIEQLDIALSEYIGFMYASGIGTLSGANNLINGIQFFYPRCKRQLYECHIAVRGWDKLLPKVNRPPLTKELCVVIAIAMAKSGDYTAAVATLLMFDCYLRVGEMCNLNFTDIVISNSSNAHFGSAYTGMAIRLGKTKTGLNQFVTVRDHTVAAIVQNYIKNINNNSTMLNSSLFGLTTIRYRKLFHL
jgi:hypothetical protein